MYGHFVMAQARKAAKKEVEIITPETKPSTKKKPTGAEETKTTEDEGK